MTRSPYASPQAYHTASAMTASPGQLVVMLYDGALRFLSRAATTMRESGPLAAQQPLQRARAIIDELAETLDPSAGQITQRLHGLYVFCNNHLTRARLDGDAAKVDEVAGILRTLREAWVEVAAA